MQITRFGGPEALDIAGIPEPEAGPRSAAPRRLTAGIDYADTHHRGVAQQAVLDRITALAD